MSGAPPSGGLDLGDGDDDGFLDYFLSLGDETPEDFGSAGVAVPEVKPSAIGASARAAAPPQLQRGSRNSSADELNPAWLARVAEGGSNGPKAPAPEAASGWSMFGLGGNRGAPKGPAPTATAFSMGMGMPLASVGSMGSMGSMSSLTDASALGNAGGNAGDELAQVERRQKRLARNRESARQSRKRKKQYLELLEEKVAQLTDEIDALRRMHLESADKALSDLRDNRIRQLAQAVNKTEKLNDDQMGALDTALREVQSKFSVSCDERLAVMRFQFEELHSLALPLHSQLLTWVLLQPDSFFRSRRSSSSERASANKIGERMMASGISTCGPDADLWPLLCHELSVTYEQEEKIRQFQKKIVEDSALQRDRRNMGAVADTLKRLEEAMASAAVSTSAKMTEVYEVLTPLQQVRYLDWLRRNRSRITETSLAQLDPDLGDPDVMRVLSTKDDEVELSEVLDLLDRLTPEDEADVANSLMNSLAANTGPDADVLRRATQAATSPKP